MAIDEHALIQDKVHLYAPGDRVHRRIYLDEDLFEQEMEKIFGHSWVYVAHESEVPNAGDYRRTDIGRQPVIVVRDESGGVKVLFNRCAHRAATVCQDECGNASFFRCAYHGWTYRNSGELIGVPYSNGYDRQDFDKSDYGLQPVPRVEMYRGFIFASLAPEGISLIEHLGNAAEFLDLFVDLSPDGEIVARSGTHRYWYDGNWKLQMENGVDGYHPNFVHEAFLEGAGGEIATKLFHGNSEAEVRDLGNGHSVIDMRPAIGEFLRMGFTLAPGPDGEDYRRRLVERLGEERAEEVTRSGGGTGFNLAVFPNLLVIGVQIRNVRPRSVGRTDVELFPTLLKGATPEVNASRLRSHEAFYGPAGGGAPDDLEMFRRVYEGLKVSNMDWLIFTRGLRREAEGENGVKIGQVTDELPQRGFYRRWLAEMAR